MNLTPCWCKFLETRQHVAFHWTSVGGALNATDREIWEYASYSGLTFLTNDFDLFQILARTQDLGPSIIVLRGEPLTPEVRGTAVLNALRDHRPLYRSNLLIDWSSNPNGTITQIPYAN